MHALRHIAVVLLHRKRVSDIQASMVSAAPSLKHLSRRLLRRPAVLNLAPSPTLIRLSALCSICDADAEKAAVCMHVQ